MRWSHGRFRRERAVPLSLGTPKLRPPAPKLRPPAPKLRPAPPQSPLAAGRPAGTPTLSYAVSSGHWWLWWPCRECGGVRLPLHGGAFGRPPVYVVRAAAAARECPGCETRRRRASAAGAGPTVWYDTLVGDWVVRLSSAAILPLELGWFDLPQVKVYRAAGDLAYLGDEFEAERPEDAG